MYNMQPQLQPKNDNFAVSKARCLTSREEVVEKWLRNKHRPGVDRLAIDSQLGRIVEWDGRLRAGKAGRL